MGEGREFPGTQMGRQKENTFTPRERSLEVFEAFVNDDLVYILARVVGEEADFGELASQGHVFAAQNAASLAARHFWKSQGQVAHSHAAQASVEQVDEQGQSNAFGAGQGTGKQPNRFQTEPDDPVFEAF